MINLNINLQHKNLLVNKIVNVMNQKL